MQSLAAVGSAHLEVYTIVLRCSHGKESGRAISTNSIRRARSPSLIVQVTIMMMMNSSEAAAARRRVGGWSQRISDSRGNCNSSRLSALSRSHEMWTRFTARACVWRRWENWLMLRWAFCWKLSKLMWNDDYVKKPTTMRERKIEKVNEQKWIEKNPKMARALNAEWTWAWWCAKTKSLNFRVIVDLGWAV